ncbi:TYR1 [Sanghuangporus vaninii]
MSRRFNGIAVDITPDAPEDEQPAIGLIGMGEMGRMYARHLSLAGWKKIYVCDRPEKYGQLKDDMQSTPGVTVLENGHLVSRISDFTIYSVEAEFIGQVVSEYGPSSKIGSIVAGQTSVKAPERVAFETYLPQDTQIVSCHSLHGPTVSPEGQPLVIIRHRASEEAQTLVESILRPLRSRFVYLSYEDHDLVTANTQAVTHAAFLSMGTAWAAQGTYPWEHGYYVGGIETVKVNITHRIYANKWHVYAGLAILNPSAGVQIDQYAASATELFKLMLEGNREALRSRLYRARQKVFEDDDKTGHPTILLSEDMLDRFSLGRKPQLDQSPLSPSAHHPPANSHLSLLAMVDCWAALGIRPFVHLALAATPIFRMWIGVAEYLFRSSTRLDHAIEAALTDVSHRADDLEFVVAARGWGQCVRFGSFELYRQRFERTANFFRPRFCESARLGTEMIKTILDSSTSSDYGISEASGEIGRGSGGSTLNTDASTSNSFTSLGVPILRQPSIPTSNH